MDSINIDGLVDIGAKTYSSVGENIAKDWNLTSENTNVKFSLSGPDSQYFSLEYFSPTAVNQFPILHFEAKNFEMPLDANGDNVYEVKIELLADAGFFYLPAGDKTLYLTVADVNESPTFVLPKAISIPENSVNVGLGSVGTDPDAGSVLSYVIDPNSPDAEKFTINPSSGQLSFRYAPNFEKPDDANGDNVYIVGVGISDGVNPTVTQAINVSVTDVNDAPIITSLGGGDVASIVVPQVQNVTTITAIDDDPGTTLTYSIAGIGDAAAFSINPNTGQLYFKSAPSFANPTDLGRDNIYDVVVLVSDGVLTDNQVISVRVTANNPPAIVSLGGGATASVSLPENQTAVATVSAVDAPGSTITYSIVGGADSLKFALNANTGALSFLAPPNFEAPTDSDANNIYDVIVRASDGELSDEQSIAVTITDVVDTPYITSDGGRSTAAISLNENSTAVTRVTTDSPKSPVVYSISGGADASKFTIDSVGNLAFVRAPDFESPTDSDKNNVYSVVVRARNGTFFDEQAISVTVNNANDAPVFSTTGILLVPENVTAVATIVANDQDAGQTLTYSLNTNASAGPVGDNASFAINPATGALAFVSAQDYETAPKRDFNVYVNVTDGIATQTANYTVRLTNVNEYAPVITALAGLSNAVIFVAENTTSVGSFVATDRDAETTITYSISGGTDAARFSIDALTGALRFVAAPDFESPASAAGTNDYSVTIKASDGSLFDQKSIIVSVTNANDAPVIASNGGGANAAVTVAENSTAVTTVTAFDQDPGTSLRYSISGGADAAKFAINATTGALTFLTAPNFEAPTDVGANNVYDVVVRASDGTLTDDQALAVTVTDVNEFAPRFPTTNLVTVAVNENSTAVTTLTATDADGSAVLTYSISGGADAARFAIDASSGALRFVTAPDYEQPADADANNGYVVIVRASDGTLSAQQILSVVINDTNDNAPVISSNGGGVTASISVAENVSGVTTVAATDADANTNIVYSISGGADAARFGIDARSGTLFFLAAPDFEAPGDADGNNIYQVQVRASDGTLFDDQLLSVAVTNQNDNAPVITTNGGGTSAALSLAENSTVVTTVGATDADAGTTIVYSIAGGSDASKFTINASTGALSFVTAPDFEAPTDVGRDNIYNVTVRASDGTFFDDQVLAVTVTNLNDNTPVITSNGGVAFAQVSIAENTRAVTTVTATDADAGTTLAYAIAGGVDAAKFTINAATGALTFITAPDFENPTDVGSDNIYDVRVSASDGVRSAVQSIAVTVTNVNDNTPLISSGPTASFAENATGTAYQVIASDDDPGTTLTFTLSGADAALFNITAVPSTTNPKFSFGNITFKTAPNFEAPGDVGRDNVYDLTVRVSDGTLFSTQAAKITVTDVNEFAPVIGSNGGGSTAAISIAENSTAATTVTATDADGSAVVTYAITGGADAAKFAINAATGVLTFVSAPDFEVPTDVGGDNVYNVTVTASDGLRTDDQAIAVTVANVNDNTPFFAFAPSANFAENGTGPAYQVIVSDADPGTTLSVTLSGPDAALFNVALVPTTDPRFSTARLTFKASPDFEAPADVGRDNVYDVTLRVSDGTLFSTQAAKIIVTNVNEAPVITSNGGGLSALISLAENNTAVTTVTATDPDAGTGLIYSITGGADAAQFDIDASTGRLSFRNAPDFDAPTDADGNDSYLVQVRASDGVLFDDQTLTVAVTGVNDSVPTITSNGGGAAAALSVSENSTAVTTLVATDADRGTVLVYSISGGADAALFAIDAGTGALSFVSAPDFETPTDAGADKVYDVIVQVSDGLFVDTQTLAVTVTNVNEAPVITSNGGGPAAAISVAENTAAVTTVTSTDPDAGSSAVYAISGGDDAALFTIDAAKGALAFIAAPDFEAPRDAGGDNVYDVTVRVSDGSLFSDQAISVTVTDATDTFVGTPGKDSITGTNGDDVLYGLGDRDTLDGLDGNDRLDGGTGNDVMKGGQGDDTYIVDSNSDKVIELTDQGTDTVLTALASYKLSDNVENLTFTYTEGAGSKGLGNALSNVLTGAASADTLVGYDGDDTLLGLGGNDTLNGGAGADLLDGGTGADTLIGGSGDDVYIVDNVGDVVREGLDGGYDTVQSSVSFTLGANIEALLLTGTDAINGTGNRLDNWLDGNGADNILLGGAGNDALYGEDGNDTLEGGAGRDDLYGGAGADTFLFASKSTPAQGSTADFVVDFNSDEGDKLAFSKAVFTGLGALGVLDEDAFYAGTAAHDASDRVIYDASTGNLYYDVDGIGRRPQVLVAIVGGWEHPALTSADVMIVA